MGIFDFFLGKPRLLCSKGKRGSNFFKRLWRKSPFWAPTMDSDFLTGLGESTTRIFGGPSLEPTWDGEQIRKYGQLIEESLEKITSVGDAYLTDYLGSYYDLYYVKEDTFEDFPARSVWLVNRKNEYFVELVFADVVGLISVKKQVIRDDCGNIYFDLSDLQGKPWSQKLIRQVGINIPE